MVSALDFAKLLCAFTEHILRANDSWRAVSSSGQNKTQYIPALRVTNRPGVQDSTACVMRWTGKVLILFLAQPAQCVVHEDTSANLITGRIRATTVKHRAVVAKH